MKKLAIIGHNDSGKTIEVIKKSIEEKLGKEVELVHINADEFHGFLPRNTEQTTYLIVHDIEIKSPNIEPNSIEIKAIDRSCCHIDLPKRKGHESPYKYHR